MDKRIFSLGALTDKGFAREKNQDSILVEIGEYQSGEFGLFAVADGMGGHAAGEVASHIVVEDLRKWWNITLTEIIHNSRKQYDFDKKIEDSLRAAIQAANLEIVEYSRSIEQIVGTTLTLMFIYDDRYWIKHIGDSRIYRINQGICQLTDDHSWVAGQLLAGLISREEAQLHPKRNVLTKCLGVDAEIDMFEVSGIIHRKDIYLICSDGFYSRLEESDIFDAAKGYIRGRHGLQEAVELLVRKARSKGEADNISAILLSESIKHTILFDKLIKLLGSYITA